MAHTQFVDTQAAGETGLCNGAAKRVPGGVVCIGGLASEGVLVVWYRR